MSVCVRMQQAGDQVSKQASGSQGQEDANKVSVIWYMDTTQKHCMFTFTLTEVCEDVCCIHCLLCIPFYFQFLNWKHKLPFTFNARYPSPPLHWIFKGTSLPQEGSGSGVRECCVLLFTSKMSETKSVQLKMSPECESSFILFCPVKFAAPAFSWAASVFPLGLNTETTPLF